MDRRDSLPLIPPTLPAEQDSARLLPRDAEWWARRAAAIQADLLEEARARGIRQGRELERARS
jgi:hypothetical protein